ncbi:DUF2190 family protein [Frigidibacter sp. MR17.24]|uniref:DUF2190 family protein n=1 Tax=Frigidibacter sp. MR17.24 TaxID=3127345 RepID=UPI0030130B50
MKNYVQPGRTVTIPAPAAVLSGDIVVAGNLVGIASGNAAQGEALDLSLQGVFDVPKIAADDFAVGARVFWNAGQGLATTTAGTNARVGTCVQAAPADSATVRVKLVQI